MFASLPVIESQIDQHIARSEYNEALSNIIVGVHNHYQQPDAARDFLYYPQFDRQIQLLADALASESSESSGDCGGSGNTLIVASMMHQTGGHSRVIADIAREVSSPTIVLTDMLWFFQKIPEQNYWLFDAMPRATIINLTQLTLWAKCRALFMLTQRLNPRNILYFNHHQDPIPFVGTLGHKGSRKTLIHHCDHHPSLGNTLANVHHVDFVQEVADICSVNLDRPTSVLPLYVADGGKKEFPPLVNRRFSVVTCGAYLKYARTGEIALQSIVRTVLTSVEGSFHFIGELDAVWVSEIKNHLRDVGIDPERFVAMGGVSSLWATLKEMDAHFYLGSAPIGGGRSAIEAQGCGYPLLFFRATNQGPSVVSDSLYASKCLGWSTLDELSNILLANAGAHASLSESARSFYELNYSRKEFLRTLDEICSTEASSD